MPTGSGKTTGAIWGIVDFVKNHPDQRLCFLTPYTEAVDKVYKELADRLGTDTVGYYHSSSFTLKEDALQKPVVVLTHQFIASNPERLDDRDLFVVDEAIYATGEATMKLEHFHQARSWATRHNVCVDAFIKLADYAIDLDRLLRAGKDKYIAAPALKDKSWATVIAQELKLAEHMQTIEDMEVMVSAQRFCEALLRGLVFLSKGNLDKDRYDPIYSAAVLGIPRMDKTIILSATGGMVYDIAGPFKQDKGSIEYWTAPSYQNLSLVQLTAPTFAGQYKTWYRYKDKVVAYVDWLLSQIAGQSVYLTLPKAILDGCLKEYLGLPPKKEILKYPIIAQKHQKTIYVSNHARSVGSNDFKECEAVAYLWEDYKPQSVAVQRFHTLANQPITDEALAEANSGKLVGNYQRIRDAQLIDNMMQQIGRGRVRAIDGMATAAPMTAYVLCSATNFVRLAAQYRDCSTTELEYCNIKSEPANGRIPKIIQYLRLRHPRKEDVPFSEVQQAVGFDMRQYKSALLSDWDLTGR